MRTFKTSDRSTRLRAGGAGPLVVLFALGPLALVDSPALAQDRATDSKLALLLDASGSMAEPDDSGAPRIDAARSALTSLVDGLNPDQQVGFRVFGATVADDDPAACTDSQQMVPVGANNKDRLLGAVDRYQPLGQTPIGFGMQEAAKDLGDEGARSILLVSDGLSTCDPDPCEVAEQLSADGVDITVNVVGLNVDEQARQQLTCIADTSGGSYYSAADTESLTEALQAITVAEFSDFELVGEDVDGAPAPTDGPVLQPGTSYRTTLSDDPLYYRIQREMAESTLWVSSTIRPQPGVEGWLGVRSALRSVATDASCGPATNGTTRNVLADRLATSVTAIRPSSNNLRLPSAYSDEECVTDESVDLRLNATHDGAGSEVQIDILEEAVPDNLASLPDADDGEYDGWTSPRGDGADGDLPSGTTFETAEIIEPGSYRGAIVPGETKVYAVDLDWGQSLQTRVDFDETSDAVESAIGGYNAFRVALLGPTRAEVYGNWDDSDGNSATTVPNWADDSGMSVVARTPEIRWMNRDTLGSSNSAALAGTHYVVVMADGEPDAEGVGAQLPFTLTAETVGTAGTGAPNYPENNARTDSSTAADTDTGDDAGAQDSSAEAADGDSGGFPAAPVVAGVVAIAVIAGAVAVLLGMRRRRS